MAPGGYAWWYLDALSDDGRDALTLIAFVGSVFSPYYAWARRRARREGVPMPPATQHVALNLALYSPGARRWAMTERGASELALGADALAIGPSALHWSGDELRIAVDEWAVPWPRRVRGRIRVHASSPPGREYALDDAGRHVWQPIAPSARIEVELDAPALRWQGRAYLDSNRGERPLEEDFSAWTWARADLAGGGSAALYDVQRRDGSEHSLALRFAADGRSEAFEPPPHAALPRSRWALPRHTRSEGPVQIERCLEDAPFYSRSLVAARWLGEPVSAFHESLSLERFDTAWMRFMLPFRMPRRAK